MQTFEQIRTQIGAWSRQNFGGQETPYLKVYATGSIRAGEKRNKEDKPGKPTTRQVVALEGLAPLMGIMEEVGEFFGAKTPADARDALGDIAVYLCDYMTREGITWPTMADLFVLSHGVPNIRARDGMVSALGDLYHTALKRHQRIRGMENPDDFSVKRWDALLLFVYFLDTTTREVTGTDTLTVLNETWNNIVSKRDWKADAAKGGGATQENVVAPATDLPAGSPVNCVEVDQKNGLE